jgi:hypothetical protein
VFVFESEKYERKYIKNVTEIPKKKKGHDKDECNIFKSLE